MYMGLLAWLIDTSVDATVHVCYLVFFCLCACVQNNKSDRHMHEMIYINSPKGLSIKYVIQEGC